MEEVLAGWVFGIDPCGLCNAAYTQLRHQLGRSLSLVFYNFSPQHFESLGKCTYRENSRPISWENGSVPWMEGFRVTFCLPWRIPLLDSPVDFTSKKHFFKAFVGSTIVLAFLYLRQEKKRKNDRFDVVTNCTEESHSDKIRIKFFSIYRFHVAFFRMVFRSSRIWILINFFEKSYKLLENG